MANFPNPIAINPLVFSPFLSVTNVTEAAITNEEFLLLDGAPFLLLDGTNFLLLGT